MTIKESLNILDTKAIDSNEKFLDLRNLYEAANLDYEKKKKLKELIDKNEDPEVIAAYLVNDGDDSTLDESILTEDDLHDVFRKDAKNQYRSFSNKLSRYEKEANEFSDLLGDIPDKDEKIKRFLGDEPKFKLDKGYNHLERQNFPYYVTHYEGTSFYHPEEGGYYVGGLEPDWSEGFESFEEAVSALGDYLEENNSARVSFNPRNVSVMDDNYAYEDSTEDYEEITDNKGNVVGAIARGKYIGEEDQIWVESNKEYLSRQSGDRMYESLKESYKLRFYHKQKGLNQGNLDHEEFFDTKAEAVNRYKEVFDRKNYALNPTMWVGDGDNWKRLSEIEINESLNESSYGDTTIEDYINTNFSGSVRDKKKFIDAMKKKANGKDYFNGLNMSVKDWEKEGRKFGLSMKKYPVTEGVRTRNNMKFKNKRQLNEGRNPGRYFSPVFSNPKEYVKKCLRGEVESPYFKYLSNNGESGEVMLDGDKYVFRKFPNGDFKVLTSSEAGWNWSETLYKESKNMKFKNKRQLIESVESPEFSAYITNLGKYNEGELIGEWVQFPIDEDDFEKVLKKIGIGSKDEFGQPYEEWFVTDYECNLNGFDWQELGEYPSYETLQEFGELVDSIDDVEAVNNAYEVTNDLKEAIEGLDSGRIIYYPGFSDWGDFAAYWIDEAYGGVENLDQSTLETYFDYEALGRDLSFDSYESEDEDGNEITVNAGEYFCGDEGASDYDIGQAFVEEVGLDGVSNAENYFDYDMFGRDFSYSDFTLTSNGVVEYQ